MAYMAKILCQYLFGTSQECADFLGMSRDNFIRTAGKIRKGIMHYVRRTYSIALIGKESDLENVK